METELYTKCMGMRTRVMKIGQNVQQFSQYFHSPVYVCMCCVNVSIMSFWLDLFTFPHHYLINRSPLSNKLILLRTFKLAPASTSTTYMYSLCTNCTYYHAIYAAALYLTSRLSASTSLSKFSCSSLHAGIYIMCVL